MPSVGKSERRKEGPEKLCGLAKYVDDYSFPGGLHGVTLRSQIPHGRVKAIRFDPSFPWSECVIARAGDIPGANLVALIENDQPLLNETTVMHPQEPILLLAHEDRQKAYEALRHIEVDYEPLEAALRMEESSRVFKEFLIQKGDLAEGFRRADVIVEGEYRVPHQEQAYIENNGMAAYVEHDGAVVVMGSLQCPYYVHKALIKIFSLPEDKVRVIQTTTGGGFGGKEEYPSMLAGHAALLAFKARRPVKMVYDRAEDMACTTKRHPALVRHKTGVTKDGRLVAQDVSVVMDGGAYATLSSVVLSRGTLHASGPYECPHVRVEAKAVATNTPPNGAFRGFGAPQTLFAAELHMEKVASAVGLSSLELRRRNALKVGSVTATGQTLTESVGALDCLETAVKRSSYAKRRVQYDAWNKKASNPCWKGIGLALCHHGAGFTGSGEVYLASRAAVSLRSDATVGVLAASTEIGQGTNTMFSQVAADALGIPLDLIRVETPDTSRVPNSGPTVASRTCMIVGGLVRQAAENLKADLISAAGSMPRDKAGLKKAAAKLLRGEATKRYEVEYEKPSEITWDDATYKGDAYGVYSYGAVVVDLEIDKTTYEVKVNSLTTAQDIGRAINPLFVEGQIIGGTVQALGYALLEKPVYKNGVMINNQLTNYIIPTALDTPAMDVTIVEKPYSRGPFGAKGVGELPMDVPGPAVAAAVYHATGALLTELPILPERLLEALS